MVFFEQDNQGVINMRTLEGSIVYVGRVPHETAVLMVAFLNALVIMFKEGR